MEVQRVDKCEHCGEVASLSLVRSMTSYAPEQYTDLERLLFDGDVVAEIPNPNPDYWLCPSCAEEYRDYWTEQWDEYHRSTGY